MNINEILKKVDHTNLLQTATESDIQKLCDEGIKFGVAAVCLAPTHVNFAKNYVQGKMNICTVVGFPNGYNTTFTKLFEAEDALKNGADEIDMVINIGWLKQGLFSNIEKEIYKIKSICGKKTLKVIVETCLLTDNEKTTMCKIVSQTGANYIKTSTGFSTFGAKLSDITLFTKHLNGTTKIKASGGINTLDDAKNFINAGASRLGTSKIIKLASAL